MTKAKGRRGRQLRAHSPPQVEANRKDDHTGQPETAHANPSARPAGASNEGGDHRERPNERVDGGRVWRLVTWLDLHNGTVTSVGTIGLLVATVVYAWISGLSLAAVRAQASAAQKIFVATERPWVTLGSPPNAVGLFGYGDIVRNGANLEWSPMFFPTNVGHSPATRVKIRDKFSLVNPANPDDAGRFASERDGICADPPTDPNAGMTIFPGERGGGTPGHMIIAANYPDGCRLYAMICVTYDDTVGPGGHHRSLFVVQVTDAEEPIPPDSGTIPASRIRFWFPLELPAGAAD
jgi:hypothetical protein